MVAQVSDEAPALPIVEGQQRYLTRVKTIEDQIVYEARDHLCFKVVVAGHVVVASLWPFVAKEERVRTSHTLHRRSIGKVLDTVVVF
jgi:hypothetical protein